MTNKLFLVLLIFLGIKAASSLYSDPNEIHTKLAGVGVTIFKPNDPPSGITFFLTGAMISLDEYNSTIGVLRYEQNQVVIGFFMNVLWPPMKNNHDIKAYQVEQIFHAFCEKYYSKGDCFQEYNIVGHSVGGQVSLLVAAKYDDHHQVNVVIALDPVDEKPSYFTNAKDKDNLFLDKTTAKITMTLTDGGTGISTKHNAEAIHENNKDVTDLVRHEDAGHMAYTDNGGGIFGKIMGGGTVEGNQAARDGAQDLIRELIRA